MSRVLVYRDVLLPKSELGFMRRQYLGFQSLQPLWIGRRVEPWLDQTVFPVGACFTGWRGLVFKQLGWAGDLAGLGGVVVHAQFGRGGALALPLAERLGLPLVVTFHGGDVTKDSHYRPLALFRLRMQRLARYASAFVCVSEGVRARLIARGLPGEKAVVLPIGTDLPDTPPRHGPGEDILFIGRFVEMKGLPVLIAALRQLRAMGRTERVVIIGDGPDRDSVAQAVAGLADVELRGWQSADLVRAALRQARVLVLPSVTARSGEAEGLPSVATEAMSEGVPVIASSEAGTDGLITDGVNGLVFPSRDSQALAAGLLRLFATPSLAESLGHAARQTVAASFNAATQSRKLEQLLLSVARR
jgi:glycosyltransferase involved in cell wall biosynthesis